MNWPGFWRAFVVIVIGGVFVAMIEIFLCYSVLKDFTANFED